MSARQPHRQLAGCPVRVGPACRPRHVLLGMLRTPPAAWLCGKQAAADGRTYMYMRSLLRQLPAARRAAPPPCAARRDQAFGYGVWSEVGSLVVGLAIMIIFRLLKIPLAEGFPSG